MFARGADATAFASRQVARGASIEIAAADRAITFIDVDVEERAA